MAIGLHFQLTMFTKDKNVIIKHTLTYNTINIGKIHTHSHSHIRKILFFPQSSSQPISDISQYIYMYITQMFFLHNHLFPLQMGKIIHTVILTLGKHLSFPQSSSQLISDISHYCLCTLQLSTTH